MNSLPILPEEEVLLESQNVENAPYSTNMQVLQVHMAKRIITKAGFHCIQLYKIAGDKESFHDQ